MQILEAQRDVRRVYRHGSVGQLVTALVWAAAAVAAGLSGPGAAMVLFFGGMLIFPLTTLALRALGGPASLPKGHPMAALALQLALQVPLGLLVVLVLAGFDARLLFPASMVIVGAHYLPFVFLYGMRSFALLGGALIAGGVALALLAPGAGITGAWVTVAALVAFSVATVLRLRREPASSDTAVRVGD